MFKEKVYTKLIFDPDIIKKGVKIRAKYRCMLGDEWEIDFEGTVVTYYEQCIYIEDPNDRDYNLISDISYPKQYRITLDEVEVGFWSLELL